MKGDRTSLGCWIAGLPASFLIRYSFRNFESWDYDRYLRPWFDTLQAGGFLALSQSFSDYTPPYLYMLLLGTLLSPPLAPIVVIKSIAASFDFTCACVVYKTVRLQYTDSRLPATLAFFAVVFSPSVIANSSIWGQTDAVFTSGLLACVYFLIQERPVLAVLFYGLALSFKLQAIFVMPVLLILGAAGKIRWTQFLLIPAVYVAVIVPSWIAGRPLVDLLLIYPRQIAEYHGLTWDAPTVYQWLPPVDRANPLPLVAGLVGAGAVALLFSWYVVWKKPPVTPTLLLLLFLAASTLFPFLLPKMHERYFFAGDLFAILLACYRPRYAVLAVVLQLTSFLSYYHNLFGRWVVRPQVLAVFMFLVVVALVRLLVIELEPAWSRTDPRLIDRPTR